MYDDEGGGYNLLLICLLELFVSCADVGHESETQSQEKHVEIYTSSSGFHYAKSERSISVYGLDDEKDRVHLVIPAEIEGLPVTEIASSAFRLEKAIVSVSIPASVTTISEYAFSGCTSLQNVSFADGSQLESIGESSFYGTALQSITFPETLVSIGEGAFAYTHLQSVILPERIESIGAIAFLETALQEIILPAHLTELGNRAFSGTDITEITIPESLTTLSKGCFAGMKIQSLYIPQTVKKIGQGIIDDCDYLATLTVACDLSESIYDGIMNSTSSGECFSTKGAALEKVYVDEDSREHWMDREWNEETNEVYYFYTKRAGYALILEDTCTEISGKVISGYFSSIDFGSVKSIKDFYVTDARFYPDYFLLEEIVIPESVTQIKNSYFYSNRLVINGAVADCDLPDAGGFYANEVQINANCTAFPTIRSFASSTWNEETQENDTAYEPIKISFSPDVTEFSNGFEYCALSEPPVLYGAKTKFQSCNFDCAVEITDVYNDVSFLECTFSNDCTVKSETMAFRSGYNTCTRLVVEKNPVYLQFCRNTINSVVFADTVNRIGEDAFLEAKIAGTIDLSGITYIDQAAFRDAVTENFVFSKLPTFVESCAFLRCADATFTFNGTIVMDEKCTSAFYGCTALTDMPNISGCIPDGVFEGTGIKKCVIGSRITSISSKAFRGLDVESIEVASDATAFTLKNNAFLYQDTTESGGIKTLILICAAQCPENVVLDADCSVISEKCFAHCTSLKSIDLQNVTTIEADAFSGLESLETITNLTSVQSIGNRAFYGCTGITGSLCVFASIGSKSFYGCEHITALKILPYDYSSAFIGDSAFENCTALKSLQFAFPDDVEKTFYNPIWCKFDSAVFKNCSALESIEIWPWAMPRSGADEAESDIFSGCDAVQKVTMYYVDTQTWNKWSSRYMCYNDVGRKIAKTYPDLVEYVELTEE